MNETFQNLDVWSGRDGIVYQDTVWLDANMSIRDGGGLRLTGSDELIDGKYQGALCKTNAFYYYGYFEAYFKIPSGYIWPAFFLYDTLRDEEGKIKNEIDIFEWNGTNIVYITTHIGTASHSEQVPIAGVPGIYRKWGLYWDADTIEVYLDDVQISKSIENIPHVPMNIEFQWSFDGWALPPSNVSFPAHFDIDWVKVWMKK